MKLSYFIVLLGTCIIVITFFIALKFVKKDKPRYFDYIFIYVIMGILLSLNTIINKNDIWFSNRKIFILIEQLIFLFQSVMLGLICLEILKKSTFKNKIIWLIFLMILIQSILLILVHFLNIEIRSSVISNLTLIIFCFFYFKNLMKNDPTLILIKSSAFWIIVGIFFSSCISFPVGTLIQFIPKNQEYGNTRNQVFSICNVSLIFMYLFFIKSYLCLKHPQII